MSDRYAKPTFSIDRFDADGDAWENGVYLHFGHAAVKVCDSPSDYRDFVANLSFMAAEINGEQATLPESEGDNE